ncbi:MAG TPA: hypothetical protein VGI22_27155 [Xanthobacteraceae bacterium]|jgi:hypothetical protein
MLTKTKVVLAAALMLGTASAALASNENDGGNETGGYVLPGSMDGVNPVYHPRWFPNARREVRETAGQAYGFVPTVKPTHHRVSHERVQDR